MRPAGRLLLLLALASPSLAHADPVRWPSWPSEVSRTAAPLLDPELRTHDRDRAAALIRLQRFPTPLIEDALHRALTEDPSVQVVREALRVCYLRRASACLEPATEIYRDTNLATLRAPALRVLATDPRGERLDLLLEALLDPSETLRAEAAQLAGWAPLRGDALARARRALLSKLSDGASSVRERAVTSLGLQGPGDGTLAIARLLEDPEPDVRSSAAVALGRLGDPKATAALLRALEGQNEGNVTRVMLGALARLPGDDVVAALLTFLDDPPPGVGALTVAEAIGDRADPEPALIDGLVERLRDVGVEDAARRALLWLGEAAAPRLEQALARGLGPRLDTDVRRLLQASRPVPSTGAAPTPMPALDDPSGWTQRLRVGPESTRLEAAAALGRANPPWLLGRVHARIARGPVDAARPWVLALAMVPTGVRFRDDTAIPWATLSAWALDPRLSETDRCVAMLGLGRAEGRVAHKLARSSFEAGLGARSARLRACTVLAARTLAPELSALGLLDDDPRGRAAAASVLDDAARLRRLAVLDPDPQVRAAAQLPRPTGSLAFVQEPLSPTPWSEPHLWLEGPVVVLGSRPGIWGVRPVPADTSR